MKFYHRQYFVQLYQVLSKYQGKTQDLLFDGVGYLEIEEVLFVMAVKLFFVLAWKLVFFVMD